MHAANAVPLSAEVFEFSSFSGVVLTDSSAMVVDEGDGGSRGDCSFAALSCTAMPGNISVLITILANTKVA